MDIPQVACTGLLLNPNPVVQVDAQQQSLHAVLSGGVQ